MRGMRGNVVLGGTRRGGKFDEPIVIVDAPVVAALDVVVVVVVVAVVVVDDDDVELDATPPPPDALSADGPRVAGVGAARPALLGNGLAVAGVGVVVGVAREPPISAVAFGVVEVPAVAPVMAAVAIAVVVAGGRVRVAVGDVGGESAAALFVPLRISVASATSPFACAAARAIASSDFSGKSDARCSMVAWSTASDARLRCGCFSPSPEAEQGK